MQSHGPGCEPDSARTGLKARDDLARATTEFDTLRGVDCGDRQDGEAVGRLGGRTIAVDCVDSVFNLSITANLKASQAPSGCFGAPRALSHLGVDGGRVVSSSRGTGGGLEPKTARRRGSAASSARPRGPPGSPPNSGEPSGE